MTPLPFQRLISSNPETQSIITDLYNKLAQAQAAITTLQSQVKAVTAAPTSTGLDVQLAYATSDLILSTAPLEIPGANLTLKASGQYLVFGVFVVNGAGAGDAGKQLRGQLAVNGQGQSQEAPFTVLVTAFNTDSDVISQMWLINTKSTGARLSLRGYKINGTGTSSMLSSGAGTPTCLVALHIGT